MGSSTDAPRTHIGDTGFTCKNELGRIVSLHTAARTVGHALEPKSGELPALQVIVDRITREFAHVRVDRSVALAALQSHIAWVERANPVVFLGRHAEALARAKELKNTTLEEVLWIQFGDDPNNLRHFNLWPGADITFGYRGKEDEELARPILERCAAVLDCDLILF